MNDQARGLFFLLPLPISFTRLRGGQNPLLHLKNRSALRTDAGVARWFHTASDTRVGTFTSSSGSACRSTPQAFRMFLEPACLNGPAKMS